MSLLIFCPFDLSTNKRGMVMSPENIMGFFPLFIDNFCFICFEIPLLRIYRFRIVIFSCEFSYN